MCPSSLVIICAFFYILIIVLSCYDSVYISIIVLSCYESVYDDLSMYTLSSSNLTLLGLLLNMLFFIVM